MTSKTTTAGSDTDQQAVLDVLTGVYKAWEAGDAETFVADYTEDASPASTRRTARRSAPIWPRRSRARSRGRGWPPTP
jgi:hypothetical protein